MDRFSYFHPFFSIVIFSASNNKVVPIDLHLVLVDSCKNFVAVKNNYKDAVEIAKQESQAVTVYKLVEVAKVSTTRIVRKSSLPKKVTKRK